jgi:hypothetical protein
VNKTNKSDAFLLNNSLRAGIKKRSIALNSTSIWNYGKQQRVLTNNDFSSSLDFNVYKPFPHFYYWGLANYSTSYSLKINNQEQAGAGIAYKLIDRKKLNFNVSDGLLYEKSDIYRNDTVRDIYNTWRNSLRLSFSCNIKDYIFLNGTNFYQNSLTNSNDYIIKSNVSLAVKIHKWLSLTTAFSYNKFSRTGRENTLYTYGLTVEKYF